MNTSHNQSDGGSSTGSRSNVDKGKQPVLEPPVQQASTPASPNAETKHINESRVSFQRLIAAVNPGSPVFPARSLGKILKNLGMSPEVEDNELRDMLKISGYADEDGNLDRKRFIVFAKDFKLLESLRAYKASALNREVYQGPDEESFSVLDRGPLGNFFGMLGVGEALGFVKNDFILAFDRLEMKLSDEDADTLLRYADLHRGIKITFEQFLTVLRRENEGYMWRTGQGSVSRRAIALNKEHRLGRVMAFVSFYTRMAMRTDLQWPCHDES